jgi:glycosyltransferase involved in cell wall biosynthesis
MVRAESKLERVATIPILIPAYKPTRRLLIIVQQILATHLGPIIVVDDGGGEASRIIFDELRNITRVSVLVNAVNLGKGAALKHGINHILVTQPNVVGIVTADADGQHDVTDIIKVANELCLCPGCLILGAREFGQGVPLRSKIGNGVSRVVYRLLLGLKLRDTQTGLRGLPISLCKASLAIRSNRYEFETEQFSFVAPLGLSLKEVPIRTIYEQNNASSHFDALFDSARIYFVVLRYGMSSMVTALVDLAVFLIVLPFIPNIIVANLASRAFALGVQFLLLRSFVFQVRAGVIRFLLFLAYVASTGVVSGVLQAELTQNTGVGVILSKIIIESGIFIFNFLFLRDILFTGNRL